MVLLQAPLASGECVLSVYLYTTDPSSHLCNPQNVLSPFSHVKGRIIPWVVTAHTLHDACMVLLEALLATAGNLVMMDAKVKPLSDVDLLSFKGSACCVLLQTNRVPPVWVLKKLQEKPSSQHDPDYLFLCADRAGRPRYITCFEALSFFRMLVLEAQPPSACSLSPCLQARTWVDPWVATLTALPSKLQTSLVQGPMPRWVWVDILRSGALGSCNPACRLFFHQPTLHGMWVL